VPEVQSDDPIQGRSFSVVILISAFLLVATLAWALYDEMYGLRPWRSYQRRFAEAYELYLKREIPNQEKSGKAIEESAEYRRLKDAHEAAVQAAAPRLTQIDQETGFVNRRLAAVTDPFLDVRGKVTALIYNMELAPVGSGSRKSRQTKVVEAQRETRTLGLPTADGKIERRQMDFTQLEAEFNGLKERKARLTSERVATLKQANELQAQLETYKKDKMLGLTSEQLKGLVRAAREMEIEIRQINVNPANTGLNNLGSGGLVDRCQSCHLAMDPKLVPPNLILTKAALGLGKSSDAPFSSHPDAELLKIHDTDKFGCSPCHGGNGRAVSSVEKAHGRYEHWLWPLYYKENFESGCQNCHFADMLTEHAPVLNRGKELFRSRGCVGCHKFEGFDDLGEQLLATRQQIRQLEQGKKEDELDIPRLNEQADAAPDNETAEKLNARATNLTVRISGIDAQIEQLEQRTRSLFREDKKVGPSLKEVRMKLRKEWIPYWLGHTHEFRPTTKMPQFRLQPDLIEAIAAFVWQSGVSGPALPQQASGNAPHGKELLETRGCLACHSIGEGSSTIGGTFAANLSRVGEKDNYDYLVRWVHNARERTRPYCPFEKRDLAPEDYAKHGLPYVFDLDHSRCPNDGHELQVQQPTIMPNLRLTWDEARDIASYLVTLKHADADYAPAPYLDDPKLMERGRALAKNYGCASCHEIATLEEEGRIATELTTEGSKPVERLDFALLTENAKRGILPGGKRMKGERQSWYDQKGFFEAKLANPAVFDAGKSASSLRMPKPNVTPEDITALATFLLGSVDTQLPQEYLYKPGDARRDIQQGWWLVTKYNCMGCHQVHGGQQSVLQTLPQYQGENKIKLPPQLIGEGARVDPNWLAHFLENPAMSKTDVNRNSVREYLQVRMPTFSFSDGEIQKLVRFFAALSSQAQPYLTPKMEPLTDAERNMARQLFTSTAAPCLKCHATGNPAHDKDASAPNFLLARERLKPAWTLRWITDPARIAPGTAMPSGLFRKDGDRWVFSGPLPGSFNGYSKDHADLLVRYMFQLTPQEQAALTGRTPAGAPGGASN
jgi:cytochrome c551/c552